MAWTRDIDFKSLLQTVKTWVFDANIGVGDSKSAPTFVEAFRDGIAANKAAHAFWRFWLNSDFDPDSKNYVDQLGDVGQTSDTDEFGRGATVASDGNIWYSEASALVVSGDKTLVFRNVASPTPDSFIYRVGAPFKLSEDRTYRVTVRWTSDTAARDIGLTISKLDRTKTFDSATGLTATIVTPNTFQYDSFVFTASGTANICHGLVYVFKDTSVSSNWSLYIDEILIEPVGGLVHRTTDAAQAITSGLSGELIAFEDAGASSDTDVTYSAGTFTVVRPGDYNISAMCLFQALADGVRYGIFVIAGGIGYSGGLHTMGGANTGGTSTSVTCRLARGDTIGIYAIHVAGADEALIADGQYNWVTIKRID